VTKASFDPYALLEALERNRVSYVIVGGFARVVQGSGELTRGLDIAPSLREENLRRLARAVEELQPARRNQAMPEALAAGERVRVNTASGTLAVVPQPWGTRGYDDIRIRANRENLGRGLRPQIASTVDLVRMLEASNRTHDIERLQRLQRMLELERQLIRERRLSRGLSIER
jgi:hypothetical protein